MIKNEMLGINDEGDSIYRSTVVNEDGTSGTYTYLAYNSDTDQWYVLDIERMSPRQVFETKAEAVAYSQYQRIMGYTQVSPRGSSKSKLADVYMKAYGGNPQQIQPSTKPKWDHVVFDEAMDFSQLELRANSLMVKDKDGVTRVKMGLMHKNRHHKAKPQPNRGPLPRKEWK